MAPERRVVWYGGQGTHALFSAFADTAKRDAGCCSTAALLLARCHEAFMGDTELIRSDLERLFETSLPCPERPEDLLNIAPQYRSHAILQGVTIVLQQLLRTVSVWHQSGKSFSDWRSDIVECSGICSGLFAASVLATSSDVRQFVAHSVAAFRTAFWTAYRSAEHCASIIGSRFKDVSWNLMLIGAKNEYVNSRDPRLGNESPIRYATLMDETAFSLCGDPDALAEIAAAEGSRARVSYIHALYHGGDSMKPILSLVRSDLDRAHITFPSSSQLLSPLRLTSLDARLVAGAQPENNPPLLELVLAAVLIDTTDWREVTDMTILQNSPAQSLSFECFGPGVSLMQSRLKKRHKHLVHDFRDYSKGHDLEQIRRSGSPDIAIVGMSFDLPGAKNIEELWDSLMQSRVHLGPIPKSRFDVKDFQSEGSLKGRTMKASHGYFLDDINSFDYAYFNISPREARSMDPQQKLLLHNMKKALEDAGYVRDSTPSFQRQTFGCYVGVATGDYDLNLRQDIDVYYSTGTLRAFLSGKISHALELSGPSVVVDTACSSSLVAIHQACQALQVGECTSAIAGGVNTISSPDMYLGLDRAHFLSPTGGCKTFDIDADGYGRGEGCTLFVLKPLHAALEENDHIHAVIRGSAINQSGMASSITHPHRQTQAKLYQNVLARASLHMDSIDFIEAHGTGTQAGDVTEMSSISDIFGTTRDRPLYVSSIKGNCGHLEAASGGAGLVKIIAMLQNACFPPQAALNTLNPALSSMVGQSIQIPRHAIDWVQSSAPRRALLNNFGAAGSNCALIIEEAPKHDQRLIKLEEQHSLPFIISARSVNSLQRLIQEMSDYIRRSGNTTTYRDLCYSSCARREPCEHKVIIECNSKNDLVSQLSAVRPSSFIETISCPGDVCFSFSGQGSLYFGMGGEELLQKFDVIGKTVKRLTEFVNVLGVTEMNSYLTDSRSQETITDMQHIVGSQCACIILEYAIAQALLSWGIYPSVVLGHSLGEFTAFAIAKILTIEDVLRVIVKRGNLMQSLCEFGKSGMLAVQMDAAATNDFLAEELSHLTLTVACENSSNDCVVGGDIVDLQKLQEECKTHGIKNKMLEVPLAFHTGFVDPILEPLKEHCQNLIWSPPEIPVISNVSGTPISYTELSAEYFANHARNSVRFSSSAERVQQYMSNGKGAVIEIGPHPTTTPLFRTALSDSKAIDLIPTLRKGKDACGCVTKTVCQLTTLGHSINWRQFFDGPQAKFISLPGHPFVAHESFVPYQESAEVPKTQLVNLEYPDKIPTGYEFLHWYSPSMNEPGSWIFFTTLAHLKGQITGHCVGGVAICPASVFNELLIEAVSLLVRDTGFLVQARQLNFPSPLIYNDKMVDTEILVKVTDYKHLASARARVYSRQHGNSSEVLHCEASICLSEASSWTHSWLKKTADVERQISHLLEGRAEELNVFTSSMLYEAVFSRVVSYSEHYQSIKRLHVLPGALQAVGTIKLKSSAAKGAYVVPPVFVDTLLHAAGFVANTLVSVNEVAICSEVECIRVQSSGINWEDTFTVYCSLWAPNSAGFLADACALDSTCTIFAEIEGMNFKKLNLSAFQRHLSNISHSTQRSESDGKITSRETVRNTGSAPFSNKEQRQRQVTQSREQEVNHLQKVCDIVADISGANGINAETQLGDIGVDSLLEIELRSALKHQFPKQRVADVTMDLTVKQLADMMHVDVLDERQDSSEFSIETSSEESSPLTSPSITSSRSVKGQEPSARKRLGANSSIEESLLEIMSEVCGINSNALNRKTTLQESGVDSLLAIELSTAIENRLGYCLRPEDVQESETVEDVLTGISRIGNGFSSKLQGQGEVRNQQSPSTINTEPSSDHISILSSSISGLEPIVILHDGSGLSSKYAKLNNLDRDVIGIASPHFHETAHIAQSIEEMAHEYLRGLKFKTSINRSSGFILSGWSFGGVVAFMMTHLASTYDMRVKGLILIDTPLPIHHKPLPEPLIAHISGRSNLPVAKNPTSKGIKDKIQFQFSHNAGMLGHFEPPRTGLKTICPTMILRSQDIFDSLGLCGVQYPWLASQDARDEAIQRWEEELIQRNDVGIFSIPGNHFEPFQDDNITQTATQVRKACERLAELNAVA